MLYYINHTVRMKAKEYMFVTIRTWSYGFIILRVSSLLFSGLLDAWSEANALWEVHEPYNAW